MVSVLSSLKSICKTAAKRADPTELVTQWAEQWSSTSAARDQALGLTRRLATELQPFLLDDLRRWVLCVDAWLQTHFVLHSACEFTHEVTIELSAVADQLSAAWTRQTLMEFCQAVQSAAQNTAEPLMEPLLPEINRGTPPKHVLEEELTRRRKHVLDGIVHTLKHKLRLVEDVLLLFDDDVELQQRVATALRMPRLLETVYAFLQEPPEAFVGHCAPHDEPSQWFVTFAMCCVGEISGAARLRGAAVAVPSTAEVKQLLLRDWIARYQEPIKTACLSYQARLKADVVSLDNEVYQQDTCRLFTAEMLDRLPRLDGGTIAQASRPSVPHVAHSPHGVSVRALRLLQTITYVQSAQKLNGINSSVLYNLLRRIERELTVATGETLLIQPTHDDAPNNDACNASSKASSCMTAKAAQTSRIETICLFLRGMQTILGQENPMLVVNDRSVPSRMLSFEDLATNIKLEMNMSTSQRLSKLVEGLLRNCVDEVTTGHICYMRAAEIRKKPGMGRNGRKIHNHILMTEYGLHRCRSVANELLLLQEASVVTFWKRWNGTSE